MRNWEGTGGAKEAKSVAKSEEEKVELKEEEVKL